MRAGIACVAVLMGALLLATGVEAAENISSSCRSGSTIVDPGCYDQERQLREEEIKRQQLENQLLQQQLLERQQMHEQQKIRERDRLQQEEVERQRQIAASEAKKKADEEEKRNSFSTGTGFFIAPNGYLVTNAHVVSEYENIAIKDQSGRLLNATVIAVDKERDLALLKVAGNFAPLRINQTGRVSKGQRVMAIGYPQPTIQGSESKVTDGVISSLTGIGNDENWFQVSVPIQGGNSGGPLINEDGIVIGVVVASVNVQKYFSITGNIPQNVNYAIKAKVLLDFLADQQIHNSGNTRKKNSIASVDSSTVLVIAKHGVFIGSTAAPPAAPAPLKKKESSALAPYELKILADRGDAEAQYKLGNWYERSEGVPKDLVRAFEWWLKAAAQGYGKAQYSVGFAYQDGEGVNRDLVRGYVWFSLAAAQGNEDAKSKRDHLGLSLTQDQYTEGKRLLSGWKKGDNLLDR